MAPRKLGITECTKPGCSNKTRSSRYKAEDYPNTLPRMEGGLCVECHGPGNMICKGCKAPLRISSMPAHLAPGTKARRAGGMCAQCWTAANPAPVKREDPPMPRVSPEDVEYTRRGLDAYLNRRRERMEAA